MRIIAIIFKTVFSTLKQREKCYPTLKLMKESQSLHILPIFVADDNNMILQTNYCKPHQHSFFFDLFPLHYLLHFSRPSSFSLAVLSPLNEDFLSFSAVYSRPHFLE